MVQVKHARLRSQTIYTSQGKFDLDAEGHFEASNDQAVVLCDEAKYGKTFQYAGAKAAQPPAKAPVAKVEEEVSEKQLSQALEDMEEIKGDDEDTKEVVAPKKRVKDKDKDKKKKKAKKSLF